jgi:uncharacterized protein with gpF-like domain
MTIGDDKVREGHNKLHGIIKPINDPFWDTHYPPNGFSCRCYAKPTAETADERKAPTNPDKGFGNNVGKDDEIFNDEHPYFTMPKGAKKNVDKSLENFKKSQKKKKDD